MVDNELNHTIIKDIKTQWCYYYVTVLTSKINLEVIKFTCLENLPINMLF